VFWPIARIDFQVRISTAKVYGISWFPNSRLGTYLREILFRASRGGPGAKQSFAKAGARTEFGHEVNPVRRGYVDDPTHWRYSSARNYARKKGLLEVCTHW